MPAVSVVIPFYNRIEWLEQALSSVLSQTFTDYEVIIVDDGSEEDASRLNRFLCDHVRYTKQPHRGRSAARNAGTRLAKGKYIAFLDADDLFMPEKIERQIALMERSPQVLLSHTSFTTITATGDFINTVDSGAFTGYVYPGIVQGCPIATPTVMVRTEALSSLCFEESVSIGEDIILWCSLARKAPILGIQQPLSKVRIHQETSASNPYQFLSGNLTLLEYACRYDSSLSLLFRLKARSCFYFLVANMFKEQGRCLSATKYFAQSVILSPTRFASLIVLCTPKKYRPYLTRLRRISAHIVKAVHSVFLSQHC